MIEDFINSGCFCISLKTLILEMMVFLWIRNPLTNIINFSSPETDWTLSFSRDSDYTPLFRAKDFFILLSDGSGIFGFIHFLDFFVQLFCFDCVIIRERIYQLLFYFFVESLCLLDVFRAFQLKTKNDQYTINLKHPLQVTRFS